MKKYELTLDQIHEIIYRYKSGYFCGHDCYGCCGDDGLINRCELCNPQLIRYLEAITEEKSND